MSSHILALRDAIATLEKVSRKTPPKTLLAEVAKVAEAKRLLPIRKEQLAALEAELVELRLRIEGS